MCSTISKGLRISIERKKQTQRENIRMTSFELVCLPFKLVFRNICASNILTCLIICYSCRLFFIFSRSLYQMTGWREKESFKSKRKQGISLFEENVIKNDLNQFNHFAFPSVENRKLICFLSD